MALVHIPIEQHNASASTRVELDHVCPSCRAVLGHDFEYCTGCGRYVGERCEKCHRGVSAEWGFCPGCGSDTRSKRGSQTGEVAAAARRGGREAKAA